MTAPDTVRLSGDGWGQDMIRREGRPWYAPRMSHAVTLWVGDAGAKGFAIDERAQVHETALLPTDDEACKALARMIDADPGIPDVRARLLRECPTGEAEPVPTGQLGLFGGGA